MLILSRTGERIIMSGWIKGPVGHATATSKTSAPGFTEIGQEKNPGRGMT